MMAGSDLDLLLLYTYPASVQESDGPKRLPVSQYFIRAAHAFVAALTAPGPDGALYDVDVRLRPSGNKGPVAVPLAGFMRYHATEAWTWERMALTRARVVAGRPAISRRAERAIAAAIATPVDPTTILADAAAMRARLVRELPPSGPWDVKLRPGGGMEVEFVAQVLQLIHPVQPVRQTTAVALRHLQAIGALTAAETAVLVRADRLWRTVQSMLRITIGRQTTGLPPAAAGALLQAVAVIVRQTLDLPGLDATLEQAAADVRAIFNQRIGTIG
jgi:glutamate-ammonia-ligase adenylyltransferase